MVCMCLGDAWWIPRATLMSLQLHHLVGHQHKVTAVRFCGSGEAVLSASADRSMKVWDISRTTYKQLVTLRHGSTPNCVDVGSDSFSAVSGHHDGGLRCWDLRTGDRTSDFKGRLTAMVNVFLNRIGLRASLNFCLGPTQICTKAVSPPYSFLPWMQPKF